MHRWGATVNDWQLTNSYAYEISVDHYGRPWMIEASGHEVLQGTAQ
ncbi:MAG: hypothetical protein HOC70_07695 [Gammaproteobacteria bacterium]|nr:hypothetical protein [Gammaproteobacteria bacterium]MBT7371809.1 hypothetical protein [Gammaproteobacteria bacterium]